jgi:deoxyribose-phosphate aldolase
LEQVLSDIDHLINHRLADEIDYVFPYDWYLQGQAQKALDHCRQAYSMVKEGNLVFKVILETGALPSAKVIFQLSQELINIGCDFLKTSTGKLSQGATPLAAYCMLSAIRQEQGSRCGIKISGGVKEPEQAYLYMTMAHDILEREVDNTWFRIGASSLLDNLNRSISENSLTKRPT